MPLERFTNERKYLVGKILAGLTVVHSLRVIENENEEKNYLELGVWREVPTSHIPVFYTYIEACELRNSDDPRFLYIFEVIDRVPVKV